jgi:antitoxin ParD1/3/4
MGTITSITVDEELADFVRRQVDDGRYGSASEVIEQALRLLKESEEDSLAAIRAAIEEGEASGEPQPFDFDEFIAKKRLRRSKA